MKFGNFSGEPWPATYQFAAPAITLYFETGYMGEPAMFYILQISSAPIVSIAWATFLSLKCCRFNLLLVYCFRG